MMKRKIRLTALVAVSVLMLALLIGGLYGYFEDTETSSGNRFTAGTLDLVSAVAGTNPSGTDMVVTAADPPNSAAGHVVFGNAVPGIKPGDSGTISWTLSNVGNVNGTVNWSVASGAVTNDENTVQEPEFELSDTAPNGELGALMQIDIEVSEDGGSTWAPDYSGPLNDLNVGVNGGVNPGLAAGAGNVVYRLTWSVPDTTPNPDNLIMSDFATLEIVFSLTQA